MRVIAVIPAYNEEQTVGGVVRATLPFVDEVVVVDDGSFDRTTEEATLAGARVVRHFLNRGLGASLGTGLAAALARGAEAVLTIDADGQHDPAEIPTLLRPLEIGLADIVLGSRMLEARGMPAHRRAANQIGSILTAALFGMYVTDSQSGFRALSRRAARLIRIRSNRMEVSSEIVGEARTHGLRIAEVPIRAIYTEYSLSKGQSLRMGFKTAYRLLLRRIGR